MHTMLPRRALLSASRIPGRPKLHLSFTDGPASTVSFAWLRDHDPSTFHPTSQQRTRVERLAPDLDARAIDTTDNALVVTWMDGTRTTFPGQFLSHHVPRDDTIQRNDQARFRFGMPAMRPWNKLDSIPNFKCQDATTTLHLSEVLQTVAEHGICLLTEAPSTIPETEAIVRAIFGPPRETFYGGRGGMWDTAPKPQDDVNDTAYTKLALDPHTDTTYLFDSPGLQVFNCVAQSGSINDTSDGCTRLVDGAKVVQILQHQYPDTFRFFRDVPLVFMHVEEGVVARTTAPVIRVDPVMDELIQFRFNSYDLAPISYLSPALVDEYYMHSAILLDTILDPSNITLVKLRVGDMIVIDNHRVLHGRTAFTGYRNLIGCYVGKDDWELRARARWWDLGK